MSLPMTQSLEWCQCKVLLRYQADLQEEQRPVLGLQVSRRKSVFESCPREAGSNAVDKCEDCFERQKLALGY